MDLRVFGIRHHGPGSARTLRKALQAYEPDCLLIEGPADADALLPFVANQALVPPVAILVYDPKDFQWAGYFPFAKFSPEWQAIKYGLKKEIETRFIDWPMGLSWEMEVAAKRGQLFNNLPKQKNKWQDDPLGYMAQLAGYDDSERWWDVSFESAKNELEVFDVIAEMMRELRTELGYGEDSNLWREAYMRREIRKSVKAGAQRIAVVCGAWHVPGLEGWESIPAKVDNNVFKGIRKRKTDSSWIPWTYERLSIRSGYAAGVESPAWYRTLFDTRKEVTIRFLTRAARLLRQERLDASSAQVIDAVRLAEELANLRSISIPGIQELREAALSTFCEGSLTRLKLIDEKLIIGDRVGKVPGDIPQVPLLKDLEKRIKSARLRAEYISTEVLQKKLDLRVDSNKKASILLHQLIALDIPWGTLKRRNENALGSFQENWRLKWRVSFSLRVIEASIYGKRVEEAASNYLLHQARESKILADLSRMAELCLLGELPLILPHVIQALNKQAAQSQDIAAMMEALPVLVRIFRYGDVRKTPPEAVAELLNQWIPRIALAIPQSSMGLNPDAAREHFRRIHQMNQAIHLLEDESLKIAWQESLIKLAGLKGGASGIVGGAVRLCLDQSLEQIEQSKIRMRYALSLTREAEQASLWLEGFLYGSGLLLIHQPSLWEIMDDWINGLTGDRFREILPLLRRSFSQFPKSERSKIWGLANGNRPILSLKSGETNADLEENVWPVLQQLLGKEI